MDVSNDIYRGAKTCSFVDDEVTLPEEQTDYTIEVPNDLGGHGGTYKLKLLSRQEYFFLKPYDSIEACNYKIISLIAEELLQFMPPYYGTVNFKGHKFIALQDICTGDNGVPLEALADVKLAGGLSFNPNFNPISSLEEISATRGNVKWMADYQLMKMSADSSPGFMISNGKWYFRLFNYLSSESQLLTILKNTSFEQLGKLQDSIYNMMTVLHNSHVALIGASIILVKQTSGDIKPILVDPAHIMVAKRLEDQLKGHFLETSAPKIFFPEDDKYWEQKTSNFVSFDAILATVKKAQSYLPQPKTDTKPT